MSDFWYVCDPDWDEAIGPLSRIELDRMIASRRLPGSALTWHPDMAEWKPLSLAQAAASLVPPPIQVAQETVGRGTTPGLAGAARSAAASNRQVDAQAKAKAKRMAPMQQPRKSAPPPINKVDKSAEELRVSTAFTLVTLRRFGARMIDLLLVMPILTALAVVLVRLYLGGASVETDSPPEAYALTWLGLLLSVPAEALMLAVFGATPGKFLFALTVQTNTGGNPGLVTAIGRQVSVVGRGLALGIPVISLITVLTAGVQTLNNKIAPWDQARQLRVTAEPFQGFRLQMAILAAVFALGFFIDGAASSVFTWLLTQLG
ncbi:MAG: RDD family protein [Ahniella sp.]|nr:RDD family protein [Ahniella sp.]